MISSTFKQRFQDLANNIEQDFKLLKEFEDALRYETNPRVKAAYRHDIKQLRESAILYQQEYDELQEIITTDESVTNIQSLEIQLHQIDTKLDILLNGQDDVSENLYQMRQTLLNHYDDAEIAMIASIAEQLSQTQLTITQTFVDALEGNQLSEVQIQEMLAVLEKQIPSLPPSQAVVAEIIKATELDAKHKLKITLPIVPFIIDYEGELEIGSGFNVKLAWEHLVSKLRNK
ncbi:hypothetical protein [aff. Roholtiella sp. LEGE 12411]|uniref:hypothetical protein n=1 Tax=aff. Roholtiella sp. LEGE 12411 TaxID=1828822 RepID=UPI0018804E81|nr:hypothetical protein [aff. Roholtiella sp. LEGE 12411]